MAEQSMVSSKTVEVEKALGKPVRELGPDGKMHTKKGAVQTVPYTYPIIDPSRVQEPSDLVWAAEEILALKIPGFLTLRTLVDHWNYGLYTNTRAMLARGSDVKYSPQQRQAIKMYGEMCKSFGLDRQVAVDSLNRQGIEDAEAVIEAFLTEEEYVPAS